MANQFINLPAPAGNGVGAAVDFSTAGRVKTFVVNGQWQLLPTTTIEMNDDPAQAGSWVPLTKSFQGKGNETLAIACMWLRVRVQNYRGGQAPDVNVGCTDTGTSFVALTVPAGNGSSAPVAINGLGQFKTVLVQNDGVRPFTGAVNIDVSTDGATDWATVASFSAPGWQNVELVGNFARVTRTGFKAGGGTPIATIAADDASGGGVGGNFALSAGTQLISSGTVVFSNSNGVSFGMSNSSVVTATVEAVKAISGGTTQGTGTQIVFSNSNGVTFGMNGNTMTASISPVAASGVGAIAAGTTLASSATVTFSNSNNVSFGMAGQVVTASASETPFGISAGTQSVSTGTMVFSNSNGISFGMSGSSRITASYSQSTSPSAISASGSSVSSGTVVFSNSNNVSFGMSGNTITANAQAVESVSAGTTFATGPQVVFSNSNNVSFGVNGNTVTASATFATTPETPFGISAGTQSVSTGTLIFSNLNGLSFGMSGSSAVTASMDAIRFLSAGTTFLPGASASLADSNGISFGANAAASRITASFDGVRSLSAGTTNATGSKIVFSNSNGVSFGANGATITASVATAAETPFGISAGTQSVSTGTVSFADSHNMNFGLSGSSRFTAVAQAISIMPALSAGGSTAYPWQGTLNGTQGSIVFSNSNNMSFGLSTAAFGMVTITASASETPFAINAGTQSVSTGTIVFSNSNGVTFGMSGSSRVTASVAAETPFGISAGTQSVSTGTLVFSNSNNVTFGMSGSSQVTASASFPAETPFAISAGTQSVSTGTLIFSNSNAISFGISGSSVVTAQFNAVKSILFPNATNTGSQTNTLQVTDFGQFSNSNGFTFGLNVRTITIKGGQQASMMQDGAQFAFTGGVSNAALSLYRHTQPMGVNATQVRNLLSLSYTTVGVTETISVSLGVYTMNGSTASLASSASSAFTFDLGAISSAPQLFVFSGFTFSFTAGDYLIAHHIRTSGSSVDGMSMFGRSSQGWNSVVGGGALATEQYLHGYSNSSFSTAMPASINLTNTNYVRSDASAQRQPSFMFLGS